MMVTWGWTPRAQAYEPAPGAAAMAGSGSVMPSVVEGDMTRPRLGVSSTVAPPRLPVPDMDLRGAGTTPPAGLWPMAASCLKWSAVTIEISMAALAEGETMSCWRRVGAMLGAEAARVSVVLAGTSREKAPEASVMACSPEARTATVAPAMATPRASTTWPETVARSLATDGVSGAASGATLSAQAVRAAATRTKPAMRRQLLMT